MLQTSLSLTKIHSFKCVAFSNAENHYICVTLALSIYFLDGCGPIMIIIKMRVRRLTTSVRLQAVQIQHSSFLSHPG